MVPSLYGEWHHLGNEETLFGENQKTDEAKQWKPKLQCDTTTGRIKISRRLLDRRIGNLGQIGDF